MTIEQRIEMLQELTRAKEELKEKRKAISEAIRDIDAKMQEVIDGEDVYSSNETDIEDYANRMDEDEIE